MEPISRRQLPLHPCSVEHMECGTFPNKTCYAVGMYELDEDAGTRAGKINIYHTQHANTEETDRETKSDSVFEFESYTNTNSNTNTNENNETNVNIINESFGLCHSDRFDAGILDMKFNKNYLACALSTSQLSIIEYNVDKINQTISTNVKYISSQKSEEEQEEDGLYLSVDWANVNNTGVGAIDTDTTNDHGLSLAVSTQKGSVRIYNVNVDTV